MNSYNLRKAHHLVIFHVANEGGDLLVNPCGWYDHYELHIGLSHENSNASILKVARNMLGAYQGLINENTLKIDHNYEPDFEEKVVVVWDYLLDK